MDGLIRASGTPKFNGTGRGNRTNQGMVYSVVYSAVCQAIHLDPSAKTNKPVKTASPSRGQHGKHSVLSSVENIGCCVHERRALSKTFPKHDLTTTQRQVQNNKKEKKAAEESQFMEQPSSYDFAATVCRFHIQDPLLH